MRAGRLHAGDGADAVPHDWRSGGRDRRRGWFAGRAAGAVSAARAGGFGRRAVAAPLRQGCGRAAASDAIAGTGEGYRGPPSGGGRCHASGGGRRTKRAPSPTGRRASTKPLVEIARAATKEEALAGFERWKARYLSVVAHLEPADILVDSMRGRFTLWYRIRVNLEHVPVDERPPQEPLEVDYDPWAAAR